VEALMRETETIPALKPTFTVSFLKVMIVESMPLMIRSATFSASAPMTPGKAITNSSPVQRPMQS